MSRCGKDASAGGDFAPNTRTVLRRSLGGRGFIEAVVVPQHLVVTPCLTTTSMGLKAHYGLHKRLR